MKIGYPRALLYYYYYPFWKVFFEELGIELVVSSKTSKRILDQGVKETVAEICVPIKIFNGHVISLLEQNVDYLFIPRMESIKKGEFFCPKFMGLPDLVRHSIPGAESKVLFPPVNSPSDNIVKMKDWSNISERLGISHNSCSKAAKKAGKTWSDFIKLCQSGYTISDAYKLLSGEKVHTSCQGDVTIGLLGYVYNIYDEFLSMNVLKRLKELDANVVTFEMLSDKLINRHIKKLPKKLFWTFSNKLLGAGFNFIYDERIDGIIHLTAFGCGPDSMLGQVLEYETQKHERPFMTVRIDEHTGENHFVTRIEAFVDMIRRSKKRRGA